MLKKKQKRWEIFVLYNWVKIQILELCLAGIIMMQKTECEW